MIDQRCQLSQEAQRRGLKMTHPRAGAMRKYAGKVIDESDDGKKWIVQWDGHKYPRPLEKVLIERGKRNRHDLHLQNGWAQGKCDCGV